MRACSAVLGGGGVGIWLADVSPLMGSLVILLLTLLSGGVGSGRVMQSNDTFCPFSALSAATHKSAKSSREILVDRFGPLYNLSSTSSTNSSCPPGASMSPPG